MQNPFLISDKVYNFLKQVALIGLPAFSTAYFFIGQTWGWDNTTKVIGTIAAVDTFLGAILGVSTKVYNNSEVSYDGTVHASIDKATKNKTYLLELNADPTDFDKKATLIFKVKVD